MEPPIARASNLRGHAILHLTALNSTVVDSSSADIWRSGTISDNHIAESIGVAGYLEAFSFEELFSCVAWSRRDYAVRGTSATFALVAVTTCVAANSAVVLVVEDADAFAATLLIAGSMAFALFFRYG